uniref:acid phosphatase n=1 Tax=Crocodylus porosus TaxID=8502 RepID=A0A7M4EEN4_CROPO
MRVRQMLCGIWSLCFLLCLLFILLHQTTAKRKLKFVSLVFRHGDHTPCESFPNDKHKENAWPQGFGQLTKLGIQQQYKLGQYLRKRYAHFLSTIYKQCEIYVQSTDSDHTLMSAQATLAGLYPLDSGQAWNPKILWQPIPVHTVPLSHDHDANNYTLPKWATQGVRDKLLKLSELLLQAEFGIHKQRQKSRLQGGKQNLLNGCSVTPTFHSVTLYWECFFCSQHAATIVALQMALNVFNGKLPPYSACHFFELYQEKNGQYTIEMHYWNNSLKDPLPLTLPGCKFHCPLERFYQRISSVIVHHWAKEFITLHTYNVYKLTLCFNFLTSVLTLQCLIRYDSMPVNKFTVLPISLENICPNFLGHFL